MIEIKLDEEQLKELYMQEVQKRLEKFEAETAFWDTKELRRQTRMSWNTITDTFFHHPDFPKFRIGGKWYFPATKAKAFLVEWLESNPKYRNWKVEKEA